MDFLHFSFPANGSTIILTGSLDKLCNINKLSHTKDCGYSCTLVCSLQGHADPINSIGVIDANANELYIATGSSDSTLKFWSINTVSGAYNLIETVSFDRGFVFDIAFALIPWKSEDVLVACASDDYTVHLFASCASQQRFTRLRSLRGHEDWVRGVDFINDLNGDLLLASCDQQAVIRLWRFTERSAHAENVRLGAAPVVPGQEIKALENVLRVDQGDRPPYYFAVIVESILRGHDGWVYEVAWQESPPSLQESQQKSSASFRLLSASMDKTMVLWGLDEATGLWIEQARVGELGGAQGAGFVGCAMSPDGQTMVAHSYHGGLHVWRWDNATSAWEPSVAPAGGHSGSVEDIVWSPGGEYLLSCGADQTTRLHAQWRRTESQPPEWHELGRPQIHGYDQTCIASLGLFRFACGADEKILRVFDMPRGVADTLRRLTTAFNVSEEQTATFPAGAGLPALGLSNRAATASAAGVCVAEFGRRTDGDVDVIYAPISGNAPPTEDNLAQNTLWPETRKLYGHGYELFALASSADGRHLASSCKATKAEHAVIILWSTTTYRETQRLPAHQLTITQMAFSHRGDRLVSVSRDRTWCLWNEEAAGFTLAARSDKRTGVHSRIIWGVAWTRDDRCFLTVSRDKKVVAWTRRPGETASCPGENASCLGDYACLGEPAQLSDSVTAVDAAPNPLSDGSDLIAVGLGSGRVHLFSLDTTRASAPLRPLGGAPLTITSPLTTVKRLKFRPAAPQGMADLAIACSDGLVAIYSIDFSAFKS